MLKAPMLSALFLTIAPALLAVLPQHGFAQNANALREGVRIEVTTVHGSPRTGTLIRLRNDSLFYSLSDPRARAMTETGAVLLAYADVKSVRVSHGRNVLLSILEKGLIGTALGGAAGAGLGAATWRPSNDFFTSTRPQAAAFYGFLAGQVDSSSVRFTERVTATSDGKRSTFKGGIHNDSLQDLGFDARVVVASGVRLFSADGPA